MRFIRAFISLAAVLTPFYTPVIFAESPAVLFDTGTEKVISYEKYGEFKAVGTNEYSYQAHDEDSLRAAAGEGVFPNESHRIDPLFTRFTQKNPRINHWEYLHSSDPMDDFYAWSVTDKEPEGVKLFYKAEALRRAGYWAQAVKAYYAIVVHFPRTIAWSADGSFYWYVAPEAISRIRKICAGHPELGVQLEGAFLDIERSRSGKPENDKVRVWPGKFMPIKPAVPTEEIKSTRGAGKVKLVQYADHSWKLFVKEKPFFVKGVTYSGATVGESAHALNLRPWMTVDDNNNRRNDGMFDSWVDTNKNNKQDADEPVIGDAALLKQMGANTIRVYHGVTRAGDYDGGEYDKDLMRTLNHDYGLYFVMGDFLGAYTVGSQADWSKGTDYTDAEQRKNMLNVLRDMVMDHKEEPYVLMWLLGNENQHANSKTNAHDNPRAFALFVNEAAKMIHALDPDHPVAVCNLNSVGLKELARCAPEVDIYGANVYSGAYSMGSVQQLVRVYYDRPILFTEMGADAYFKDKGVDEKSQSDYFEGNWEDILFNSSGKPGEGNGIGGIQFEWMDEWWKSSKGDSWGDPDTHNREADHPTAFRDGWANEEWFGIFGQGNGSHSPLLREPRQLFETMKKEWTK